MATNFPSSLDSFSNPSATDAMDSATVPHADQHANVNDAVEALQAKVGTGAGTIGTWQTYTPTATNCSGTFSNTEFCKVNQIVFYRGQFNLSSAASGAFQFSLPVTASEPTFNWARHQANLDLYDASANSHYRGWIALSSSTNLIMAIDALTDTIGSTQPFTWVSGDQIFWSITYRAA